LLRAKLIKPETIIANSLSGVSGAGRKAELDYLFVECNESIRPYGIPKHRHLSEEVFYAVEGSGYDLHWDVRFDCKDKFEWSWEEEPKRFEWTQGDFVYIPPYCTHKHFNSDLKNEARIVVINSRIIKPMGFDWFEQLENAEGY